MHELVVIFTFIVILTGIVCCTAYTIVRMLLSSRKSKGLNGDETKVIQEIYQGLAKMEQRVESLETILTGAESRPSKQRADMDL